MARILIVEDDATNAQLAALICRAAGHSVSVAGNGIEALVLLDYEPFDVVLADIVMPMMDGITMTRQIRRSGCAYAAIPIIGMTGRGDHDLTQRLLDAGMTHLVTKPYRHAALTQALEAVLRVKDAS